MSLENRREAIIKKYGSWEEYENKRAITTRKTALDKCKTEEEREIKLKKFTKEDIWKASVSKENIGKEIICSRCNSTFVAGSNQHLYCRKCILAIARIEHSGSLEEYYKNSKIKEKETMKLKYGNENYNNRDKARETCIEHFGVDHQFKSPDVLKKSKQTRLDRYGDENYNNSEKMKDTCLERYGVTTTLLLPEMVERIKQIKFEKYGDENYRNKEKHCQTCIARYGVPYPSQSKEIREKIKATVWERYGASSPIGNILISEKIKSTLMKRYGVDNYQKSEEGKLRNSIRMTAFPPMANPDSIKKMIATTIQRYGTMSTRAIHFYDNNYFDSSWELAYYIYLTDHQLDFIYKPEPLSYKTFDGKLHSYFPDFLVGIQYIEIKGNSLINSDNVLIDYYGNTLPEKTQCLQDNNVLILKGTELKSIFDYIDITYGKQYLKSFRVHSTHKQERYQND